MKRANEVDCPCCRSSVESDVILKRAPVPILQNTTIKSKLEAIEFSTASLQIVQCPSCGFVWNSDFRDDKIIYDENYNNDVSSSSYYMRHLEERVDAILDAIPLNEPIHYVEIGCGEADFLRLFVERAGDRVASAMAFDPSFSGEDKLPSGVVVHKEFFTEDSFSKIKATANVFVSRHTIEHISNPNVFAKTLARVLDTKNKRLFVETPTVDWIFENVAFFDFFYEHCSLFNPSSIGKMFSSFGLNANVQLVYGGQYLWGEFRLADKDEEPQIFDNPGTQLGLKYKKDADQLVDNWRKKIGDLTENRRVGIWGAASKGVTFALIMKSVGINISFAIDLNESKQGHFMPLTGIEIQSPNGVGLTDNDVIIVMNPNYYSEICADIGRLGINPEVLTMRWSPNSAQ